MIALVVILLPWFASQGSLKHPLLPNQNWDQICLVCLILKVYNPCPLLLWLDMLLVTTLLMFTTYKRQTGFYQNFIWNLLLPHRKHSPCSLQKPTVNGLLGGGGGRGDWCLLWELYKHVSTLCQRSAGFRNITSRDTCSYQFALNG